MGANIAAVIFVRTVMKEIAHNRTSSSVIAVLRRWWFQMVYEIFDRELQRRTWLDPTNRNRHWSYAEVACSFPRVAELDDAERRGIISAEEHAIMVELSTALHRHKAPGRDIYDNAAVLKDPAWRAVTARADLARRQLLVVTTDASEREELLGHVDLD
jgi:hypothetical protein